MSSMNVSNSRALSAGIILWPPSYLDHSLQIAQSKIQLGARGLDNLCEITEEYRIGNAFDILASIGGLLALFQGLHVLLFGRPLFWGLFGSKLISPFGLFGKCTADRQFRRRLRERYYPPITNDPPSRDSHRVPDDENIYLNRFLLDFVIDMGPAAVSIPRESQSQLQPEFLPEHPLPNSPRTRETVEMEPSVEATLLGTPESSEYRLPERREQAL